MTSTSRRSRRRFLTSLESLDERVVPAVAAAIPAQAHHALAIQNQFRGPGAAAAYPALAARPASPPANRLVAVPATAVPAAVPAGPAASIAATAAPRPARPSTLPLTPVSTNGDSGAASLAKLDPTLQGLYSQYLAFESAGGQGTFTPSPSTPVLISGNSVALNIRANGNAAAAAAQLADLGMTNVQVDAATGVVEGYLPIDRLAAVASSGQFVTVRSVSPPYLGGGVAI